MNETSDHQRYRKILKSSLETNYLKRNENGTSFSMEVLNEENRATLLKVLRE